MTGSARPGRAPLRLAAAVLACLLAGCAGARPAAPPASASAAALPRVALLPLENLTGQADAGDQLTRMLFVSLQRTGRCDLVEAGDVERVLAELRIRPVGTLTRQELTQLADTLGVGYVLLGSVLESGVVHTADGDVPSIGIALKLLASPSGRVVWANMRVRTGEDHERLFGWGRRTDRNQVAAELATEIFQDFHIPGAVADTARAGDKP